MEFLIAAVIGGVALARAALLVVTWRIVSAGGRDNGIDWLTHTFGNGGTAREVERSGEKRRAVMSRLGVPCGR